MSLKMGSVEETDRSCLGELVDPNVTLVPKSKFLPCEEHLELGGSLKGKKALTIDEVKELWEQVKTYNRNKEEGKRIYLNELLADWEVNIPSLQIPERNPELEKRLKVLRNKLDEQEYERMTRNVNATASAKNKAEDSIGRQIKQMNSDIIAAVQFVISLAAAFFFGFSGVQVFTGELNLEVRLLLGIASAVIVGLAELYVLVVMLDASAEGDEKVDIPKQRAVEKKTQ